MASVILSFTAILFAPQRELTASARPMKWARPFDRGSMISCLFVERNIASYNQIYITPNAPTRISGKQNPPKPQTSHISISKPSSFVQKPLRLPSPPTYYPSIDMKTISPLFMLAATYFGNLISAAPISEAETPPPGMTSPLGFYIHFPFPRKPLILVAVDLYSLYHPVKPAPAEFPTWSYGPPGKWTDLWSRKASRGGGGGRMSVFFRKKGASLTQFERKFFSRLSPSTGIWTCLSYTPHVHPFIIPMLEIYIPLNLNHPFASSRAFLPSPCYVTVNPHHHAMLL